jgi:DNA polymerase III sliding clamp (beta) subunit (PCNA family)
MAEYLSFRVGNAAMFRRAIEAIERLIPEACFEASDGAVVLRQMDPTHIALATLRITGSDLLRFEPGEKFCLNMEKLATVLGRLRPEDETVEMSVVGDKVRIAFPETKREYMIFKIELEGMEIPSSELEFTAETVIPTRELKSTVKDMDAMRCTFLTLEAQEDKLLATCEIEGERYVRSFEPKQDLLLYRVSEPAKAHYDILTFDKLVTTSFEIVRLRWSEDYPISMTYDLSPHSSLEFILAPRTE